MHLDPEIRGEAVRLIANDTCPRHVLGFVDNPDHDDQRDDAHMGELARELIDDARIAGHLLIAFPGSGLIDK